MKNKWNQTNLLLHLRLSKFQNSFVRTGRHYYHSNQNWVWWWRQYVVVWPFSLLGKLHLSKFVHKRRIQSTKELQKCKVITQKICKLCSSELSYWVLGVLSQSVKPKKSPFHFFSLVFWNNDLPFSSSTYRLIINNVDDEDLNQKCFDHRRFFLSSFLFLLQHCDQIFWEICYIMTFLNG